MKNNFKYMKKRIKKIKAKFTRKPLLVIPDVSGSCESPQDNNGDLVPLVWMIKKIIRKEGGHTMNEIVAEAKRNFKGIEQIKHRTNLILTIVIVSTVTTNFDLKH